jgi:putative CocE/NonD family hydrolase
MANEDDVVVPMHDAVTLLADVRRPSTPCKCPVLIAASPYPRQIQNLGASAGFIEAGATDFFVPSGYLHVIANCRGTSGSGGFFDGQERRDRYDLVECAAEQPWSDGNVGRIGMPELGISRDTKPESGQGIKAREQQ